MYDVALLIERQLNELDADQIIALHEGLEDTVRYHLLLPVQPSAAVLDGIDGRARRTDIPMTEPDVLEDVQNEIVKAGQSELDASAALLQAAAPRSRRC